MVTMTTRALGNLRCETVHEPSNEVIQTDAPIDVGGEAKYFSPTDLVGAAFLTCVMTTMGLEANKLEVDLTGMTGSVDKVMKNTAPRRIASINLSITVPLAFNHPAREKLERAAHSCPVHHSLHPDIEKEITISWIG